MRCVEALTKEHIIIPYVSPTLETSALCWFWSHSMPHQHSQQPNGFTYDLTLGWFWSKVVFITIFYGAYTLTNFH
jgi:hypothetical protein